MKDRITVGALSVVIGASALVVGSVGVGVSLAGGTSHTVHSCYAKHGGALRVVRKASACHNDEKSLSFNQRGPRGARGFRGLRGPAGPVNLIAAQVDAAGGLLPGSSPHATSATFGSGHYVVHFDRTVDACHYWVQPGFAGAPTGKFLNSALASNVLTDGASSSAVDVTFESPGQTRFMVFVLC